VTEWPKLITTDGEVDIPAQPCPYLGERTIRVYVRYPGGSLDHVDGRTGLMLSLHNWGGTAFIGAPDPQVLSSTYNVVAIGVDYLQSGETAPPASGHPYDTGYLQALDALRALFYVYSGLADEGAAYDRGRLYATGGSGGGNVSLMANKLGPRTFACIVDLSGLASLTDARAFGLEGGGDIHAGYSPDPDSPNYLAKHAQQIRDPGNVRHLEIMKSLGNAATVVTVHGVQDESCCVIDKRRVMDSMRANGLDVHPNYITPDDVDNEIIRNAGHAIGNRTQLLVRYAGDYLSLDSAKLRRTSGRCDFDCRDQKVLYPTDQGHYVIDYSDGYPTGRFIQKASAGPRS